MGQPKTGNANQDRKVPPPIGTERLARIRQGGSVTPTPLGTNFTAPVGHSGIWSFGVNSVSGKSVVQPGEAQRNFWGLLEVLHLKRRLGKRNKVPESVINFYVVHAEGRTDVSGGRVHVNESTVVLSPDGGGSHPT